MISRLDALVAAWLRLAPQNTLNLAHRKDAQGRTHLIFIPRIDGADKHHPPEISNGFAGCEVCGRINIEDREEWARAIDCKPGRIDAMLEAVSPPAESIGRLESLYGAGQG